jgi:hypothetical protein
LARSRQLAAHQLAVIRSQSVGSQSSARYTGSLSLSQGSARSHLAVISQSSARSHGLAVICSQSFTCSAQARSHPLAFGSGSDQARSHPLAVPRRRLQRRQSQSQPSRHCLAQWCEMCRSRSVNCDGLTPFVARYCTCGCGCGGCVCITSWPRRIVFGR